MKREKKLLESTIVLFIGNIIPRLVQFLLLPILTTSLTKSDYGLYELVATLLSCLIPLAILQMNSAAFRYLLDVKEEEKKKTIISSIVYIIYTVVICISFLSLVVVSLLQKRSYAIIIFYFLSESILTIEKDVIRGLQKTKLYSLVGIFQSICNLVLIIAVFHIGNGTIVELFFALSLASWMAIVIGLLVSKMWRYISFAHVDLREFKEMLLYAVPMIPNGLSHWIVDASDRLIVSVFLGLSSNGIYSAASKIPAMLNLFQTTFVNAWQENASIYLNDKDSEAYFTNTFRRIFSIFTAIVLMLIACVPVLFLVLLGPGYDQAYNHIIILIVGVFFNILSSVIGGLYVAMKKSKEIGVSTVVAAIINMVINIVLVNFIGLYAASLSTMLSYFVLFVYRIRDIRKHVSIKFDYRFIIFNILFLIGVSALSLVRNVVLNIVIGLVAIIYSIFLNLEIIKKVLIQISLKFKS